MSQNINESSLGKLSLEGNESNEIKFHKKYMNQIIKNISS